MKKGLRPEAFQKFEKGAIQLRIAWAVGSNSRASSSGVRPVRANSTIWRRKAGGYGGLDFGIVDTSSPKGQVSTKSGQLQLTQVQIDHLKRHPGLGWVSALRAVQMRSLVESEALQLSLFDEQHLAEFVSPDYPGERLVACYNPLLAEDRARKRETLLTATEAGLERIAREAARRTRTPLDAAQLGHKVGRVIARHKMAKHFHWEVHDGRLVYERDHARIDAEARLDGIYVLRTSEPAARLSPEDTVRTYKGLADVERWFRTLKGLDIRVRPIRHREQRRVRAHLFLCLLAGYLEWHLRRAWAPLLFDDETLADARRTRDPVAPAKPTERSRHKKASRRSDDGWPLHSLDTLLGELATRCRNTCRVPADPSAPALSVLTEPTSIQRRAAHLIETFPVPGTPES